MPSDTKYRQVPVDVFLKDFVLCRESLSSSPKPKEELVPSECIDNAGGDMFAFIQTLLSHLSKGLKRLVVDGPAKSKGHANNMRGGGLCGISAARGRDSNLTENTSMETRKRKRDHEPAATQLPPSKICVPILTPSTDSDYVFHMGTPSDRRDWRLFYQTPTNDGKAAREHLEAQLADLFLRQRRTHVFAIYAVEDKARFLFVDRSGVVVSQVFYWNNSACGSTPSSKRALERFLEQLESMSDAERGFDSTVSLATGQDVDRLRRWNGSTAFVRARRDDILSGEADGWPVVKVKVGTRDVLVGKPMHASSSLVGRCTLGYAAFDLRDGKLYFLKDCWRIDDDSRKEHLVLEKIVQSGGGEYVATCLFGGDVCDGQATKAHRTTCGRPLKHYRLLILELCRPLTDFADFRELAVIFLTVLRGHRHVWEHAGILHGDISAGNILINEYRDSSGKLIRTALLNDWDLCEPKAPHSLPRAACSPTTKGTWFFRSAMSLQYPRRPLTLSDDLESFTHVFHFLVLSFRRTSRTHALARFVESMYAARYASADGARGGGDTKWAALTIEGGRGARGLTIRAKGQAGGKLNALMREMEGVGRRHYKEMDSDVLDDLYGAPHPGRAPSSKAVSSPVASGEDTERKALALDDHCALVSVFAKYSGEPVLDGSEVKWTPKEARRSECNLLEVAQTEREKKRSTQRWFESSESTNWWGIKDESEDEQEDDDQEGEEEPFPKRRKLGHGATAPRQRT